MNRRRFLAVAGLGLTGVAGCATTPGGDDPATETTATTEADPELTTDSAAPTGTRADTNADTQTIADASLPADRDGYPESVESVPPKPDVPGSFPTVERNGQQVPLLSLDVAHYWWATTHARFADARGRAQWRAQHIVGAVSSPAGNDLADDPVDDWAKSDHVVCYCGCPHHLSSIRAADLLANGYENVYVVDEGYWAWKDAGLPVAGDEVASTPEVYVVRGRTDRSSAGGTAWAVHERSGQREATAIARDGSYELELRFVDVGPSSVVTVETPDYRVAKPLAELTADVVTGGR